MTQKTRGQGGRDDPRAGAEEQKKGPGKQEQSWPGKTDEMSPRPDHGEESYRGCERLSGKVALITGGDSGIGRAVAIAFAREGADVCVAYYESHEDADETLRWIQAAGRKAKKLSADLTDPTNCKRIVEETVAEMGKLDILVNNAAFQWQENDFAALSHSLVEQTFRTNILAYLYVAQAAVAHLPAGGVILNTGSVTAMEGHPRLIDYSATKGAIHTLTKSLARALASQGIRVNCVAPGPVWTPLIPATLEPEHVEKFGTDTLWGRAAQPAEIAPSYVFLASTDGRYYTGEILSPTGRSTSR